jgi:hypothetical protein
MDQLLKIFQDGCLVDFHFLFNVWNNFVIFEII